MIRPLLPSLRPRAGLLLGCLLWGLVFLPGVGLALEAGDSAPALHIKGWVGGEGVDPSRADGDTISVLLFWASWNRASRAVMASMDRFAAAGAERGGVRVMAITSEGMEAVEAYLEEQPLAMVIGLDDKAITKNTYLAGAEQGIPLAVVVDPFGKVVWRGQPGPRLEEVVRRLEAGTFDLARSRAKDEALKALQAAAREEDVPAALEAIDRLLGLEPDNHGFHRSRARLLMREGQPRAVHDAYRAWRKGCEQNPAGLLALSRFVQEVQDVRFRDPVLALETARTVHARLGNNNAAAAITHARAYADLGLFREAIYVLEGAEANAEERMKPLFRVQIRYYQQVLETRARLSMPG